MLAYSFQPRGFSGIYDKGSTCTPIREIPEQMFPKQDVGEPESLRRVLMQLFAEIQKPVGLVSLQFHRVTQRVIPMQMAEHPWNHFRGVAKIGCQAPSQTGVRGTEAERRGQRSHSILRTCEQSPQDSEREAGEACRDR